MLFYFNNIICLGMSSQTANQLLHLGVDDTGRKIHPGGIAPGVDTSLSERIIVGWNFPLWAKVCSSPRQLERALLTTSESSLDPNTRVVGSGAHSEAITTSLLQQLGSHGLLSNGVEPEGVGGRTLSLSPESPKNQPYRTTQVGPVRPLVDFLNHHLDPDAGADVDVTGCKKEAGYTLEDTARGVNLTKLMNLWLTKKC